MGMGMGIMESERWERRWICVDRGQVPSAAARDARPGELRLWRSRRVRVRVHMRERGRVWGHRWRREQLERRGGRGRGRPSPGVFLQADELHRWRYVHGVSCTLDVVDEDGQNLVVYDELLGDGANCGTRCTWSA